MNADMVLRYVSPFCTSSPTSVPVPSSHSRLDLDRLLGGDAALPLRARQARHYAGDAGGIWE